MLRQGIVLAQKNGVRNKNKGFFSSLLYIHVQKAILCSKYIHIYLYKKKKKIQKYLVCFKNIIANVFLGDVGVIGHASKVIVSIKQL